LQKFLIIQTAFIGDVILATGVAEKLHQHYPDAQIDFMLRKGNEALLENHPFINEVLIFNKKEGKLKNLFALSKKVRSNQYDYLINLHRFGSSGFITTRSSAKRKIGFNKNPFSWTYHDKVKHEIGDGKHEVERNHELIASLTDEKYALPRLYPTDSDRQKVAEYQNQSYVCIAPTSVWFTKQFPPEKWVELINKIGSEKAVYLLGGPGDRDACESIKSKSQHANVTNLSGQLSFLQSAALMAKAEMNYVNDSAPMHMCSATDAPVTAIYCSTVPRFGFGPLSPNSKIVETAENLDCRPCGLHGFKACPKGHFKCAKSIETDHIVS
jgi:lipopolysaccharide heptosyltransferase II